MDVHKRNKVTVITVVYNNVEGIRTTLESFVSQSWSNKEIVVVDGGSTDGTWDVINSFAGNIAYKSSEPDRGIYDAMNKGIDKATGEWIIFLNSGDVFVDSTVLERVFENEDFEGIDDSGYELKNGIITIPEKSGFGMDLEFAYPVEIVKPY